LSTSPLILEIKKNISSVIEVITTVRDKTALHSAIHQAGNTMQRHCLASDWTPVFQSQSISEPSYIKSKRTPAS